MPSLGRESRETVMTAEEKSNASDEAVSLEMR